MLTREQKIEAIRLEAIKANDESLDLKLDEVMLVLKNLIRISWNPGSKNSIILQEKDFSFTKAIWEEKSIRWELPKSLMEQGDSVIDFIHSLLPKHE